MPLDKIWEDEPDLLGVLEGTVSPTSTTPLDAAAMRDLEARVQAEIDSVSEGAINSGDSAGGDLRGTYPNPEFAVDMATQTELNAVASSAIHNGNTAGGVLSGTYPNPGFAADMATQAELDTVSGKLDNLFVDAVGDHGATGDGATDDTRALQAAIDAAIAADIPLYLPPGSYRTTAALTARASDFAIFGAGTRQSVIVSDRADYDVLTIGPGAGGSGNSPSGYARDFAIEGGDADWSATGAAAATGKAAFKLDGMRQFEVTNVSIEPDSDFDIGFDLTNNSHACTFRNCRTGFNGCRVGVNIRESTDTGNDVTFFNCWLFGEVAAVHMAAQINGFHFYGGQMTASWQAARAEDDRGVLILAKDYLTGVSKASAAVNLTFDGIDFENFQYCWLVRSYEEVLPTFRNCSFNASAANPALGFFKGTALSTSHVHLDHNQFAGDYSGGADIVSLAGENGSFVWEERGSWGAYDDAGGSTNAIWSPMMLRADINQSVGSMEGPVIVLNGLLLRRNGTLNTLDISDDWGATWRIASPEGQSYASADVLTVDDGIALAKITGTTEIRRITATRDGHFLVLKFAANCTLTNGNNLKLSANFSATANDIMTLVCDGTDWYEVGRSVN